MTLTAHAVVGATMVQILPGAPVLAVTLALSSHFILDAIPHWDYPLRSASKTKGAVVGVAFNYDFTFLRDLFFVSLDILLGLLLVWLLYRPAIDQWPLLLAGVVAAILPDFLQFAYGRYGGYFLTKIQWWHNFCHSQISLNSKPFWGVSSQAIIVTLIVVLLNWLFLL